MLKQRDLSTINRLNRLISVVSEVEKSLHSKVDEQVEESFVLRKFEHLKIEKQLKDVNMLISETEQSIVNEEVNISSKRRISFISRFSF
jgi:hypothetical protein